MLEPTNDLPPGISLRIQIPVQHVSGHYWEATWSCDGKRLATSSGSDWDIWEVDTDTWSCHRALSTGLGFGKITWSPADPDTLVHVAENAVTLLHIDGRQCSRAWQVDTFDGISSPDVSFSPNGGQLAVADYESHISILDTSTGRAQQTWPIDLGATPFVTWSPDGRTIAAFDQRINELLFLSPFEGQVEPARGHVSWAAWSPDGSLICVAHRDHSIRTLNATGTVVTTLEGHTSAVMCVVFSHDGRLLYSLQSDGRTKCWRTDTWQCVAEVGFSGASQFLGGLAINPRCPVLARRADQANVVELFEIDIDRLLEAPTTTSQTYANAKVVLVGDTGVGKSGLGLVLTNQPFRATDSTHARQVWTFDAREVQLADGHTEKREILLWDLAGQPGYRLIHQLHLGEAAAALVVFDARSESDPFAGVRYWMRVLRQYRKESAVVILVAARIDRGGIPASRQRIAEFCDELGGVRFLETSAKDGRGIAELAEVVRTVIDWEALPWSVSTELFETIKRFLIDETRDSDRALAAAGDLFRLLVRQHPEHVNDGLRASFDTCVGLLESRDLVRRLSFGGFVLLRPELLDSYASALIDAAREQPDGLGYIAEDDALNGNFPIPEEARLPANDERLLLIAMVEELLRHDLALREPTDSGVDLVFPSQFTQDRPDEPDSATADVVFRFEGAVNTIYATLAVRLSHVADYQRERMWRNASTYRAVVGGSCGLRIRISDEGQGELTLFFDEAAGEQTRFLFENYVYTHLVLRALPRSVVRERVFRCIGCGYRLPADLVRRKQARGRTSMTCPDCEGITISLLDREDRLAPTAMRSVHEMNASADAGRDRAAATAVIKGKETTGDFDVFLSYNSKDRGEVAGIAERLRGEGVLPWFDVEGIRPGERWQERLAEQIGQARSGAVFLGPHGLGTWQEMEQQAFVSQAAGREFPIIPVWLPGATGELPVFLRQWQAVDFRVEEPDPFTRLLWAVRGERWRDFRR